MTDLIKDSLAVLGAALTVAGAFYGYRKSRSEAGGKPANPPLELLRVAKDFSNRAVPAPGAFPARPILVGFVVYPLTAVIYFVMGGLFFFWSVEDGSPDYFSLVLSTFFLLVGYLFFLGVFPHVRALYSLWKAKAVQHRTTR